MILTDKVDLATSGLVIVANRELSMPNEFFIGDALNQVDTESNNNDEIDEMDEIDEHEDHVEVVPPTLSLEEITHMPEFITKHAVLPDVPKIIKTQPNSYIKTVPDKTNSEPTTDPYLIEAQPNSYIKTLPDKTNSEPSTNPDKIGTQANSYNKTVPDKTMSIDIEASRCIPCGFYSTIRPCVFCEQKV